MDAYTIVEELHKAWLEALRKEFTVERAYMVNFYQKKLDYLCEKEKAS